MRASWSSCAPDSLGRSTMDKSISPRIKSESSWQVFLRKSITEVKGIFSFGNHDWGTTGAWAGFGFWLWRAVSEEASVTSPGGSASSSLQLSAHPSQSRKLDIRKKSRSSDNPHKDEPNIVPVSFAEDHNPDVSGKKSASRDNPIVFEAFSPDSSAAASSTRKVPTQSQSRDSRIAQHDSSYKPVSSTKISFNPQQKFLILQSVDQYLIHRISLQEKISKLIHLRINLCQILRSFLMRNSQSKAKIDLRIVKI